METIINRNDLHLLKLLRPYSPLRDKPCTGYGPSGAKGTNGRRYDEFQSQIPR
jgi:hypothetical protein